jgi:hypothetical protein
VDESLAVLLLPERLEGFRLETHARDLLSIPRVIALEPSRFRAPRFMRDATMARQGSRLRFPGALRVVVLYHPALYPLARALCSRYPDAELWYVTSGPEGPEAARGFKADELLAFDDLARERARRTLSVRDGTVVEDEAVRARLRELDVISPRAFIPGGRFRRS